MVSCRPVEMLSTFATAAPRPFALLIIFTELTLIASELVTEVHIKLPKLNIGFATPWILLYHSIQNLECFFLLVLLAVNVYLSHGNLAVVIVISADGSRDQISILLSYVQQVTSESFFLCEEIVNSNKVDG